MKEFYKIYEQLICYFSSRSKFSIRAPKVIASCFFIKTLGKMWPSISGVGLMNLSGIGTRNTVLHFSPIGV